jgi:hypothetical protein
MSFKRFDLDQDTFTNNYSQYEGVRIYYQWMSGFANEVNTKLPNHYSHDGVSGSYFVEIYDRPKSDISAVKLMTMTYGYTSSSVFHSGAGFVPNHTAQKLKMYRLMAKRLLGDEDKKFVCEGTVLDEAIFLLISRNQYRDEIVPRSTKLTMFFTGAPGQQIYSSPDQLTDNKSKILNEFAGPYTNLYDSRSEYNRGLMFAKAGVYVIDPQVVSTGSWSGSFGYDVLAKGVSGTTFNDLLWAIKHRIAILDFTGSSKVESAFYKCVAAPAEFNYSTNPSFTTEHQEVKSLISASFSTTYITQIGLLGEHNELLAIGKLHKPIKKDSTIGITIHVRVDQ